ncbi:MAG: DUF6036 family nucleotidyltransferase [Bacteroidota bacterium]
MDFETALKKIVGICEAEQISYMIVGGFATSYHNRFRFTADIDLVIQIYPHDIEKIMKYFPEWSSMTEGFKDLASRGIVFDVIDMESGVKFDFMIYQDSDYNWTAFERRRKVEYFGVECYISSKEDLIISKLKWYSISESTKQLEDIKFLLKEEDLNWQYLEGWTNRLLINRYDLF